MAILRAFVTQTWFDSSAPQALSLCAPIPPGVPFTVDDLTRALLKAPALKAVASPFPPNLLWKANAEAIARIVHADLARWWSQWPPHVPTVWQQGWLIFIGKPNRPPTCPGNLRALAMQEPVGKVDQLIKSQSSGLRNLQAGSRPLQCYGGIQLFVDLEKAFDTAPRAEIMKALHLLDVPSSLISILGAWHSNTHYVLTHHELTDVLPTNRGVRQGCVAAPALWSSLMFFLMHNFTQHVSADWIRQYMTVFADDVHLCQVIYSAPDLDRAIEHFGRFFTCAHALGLKINFRKTEVMLRLAGSWHTRIQSKHILRTSDGMVLCIPYGDGLTAHIPMKSAVTYLGARISYHNSSKATVAHRIAASKHVFHRLKIWLSCNSQIPINKRYQLWKATVFSTMIYGIFTVGLTPQGLTNIQIEIMRQLRSIAGDYSQITALSHQAFLAQRCWSSPASLLLTRVEGMIARLFSRHLMLDSADIVLRCDWQHLQSTALMLRQAMATDSTSQALHAVLNPNTYHACHFCSRTFATVAAMKLHMHREHEYQQRTFRHVQFSTDSTDGMPHCHVCDFSFPTWHAFHRHMALHIELDDTKASLTELDLHLNGLSRPAVQQPALTPAALMRQPRLRSSLTMMQ
eukprot:s1524_g3.t1